MQIVSWNVNGIRACWDNGLADFLQNVRPEIITFQEVKSQEAALPPEIRCPSDYQAIWHCGGRPGYSGVGAFVRSDCPQPEWTLKGIGIPEIDAEGRVLTLEFEKLFLVTSYFPNSAAAARRLDFKIKFCRAMATFCRNLQGRGKGVVLMGDLNIAPADLDLHSPQEARGSSGTLKEEVAWMSDFLASGWVDVFRRDRVGEEGHYSWWSFFDEDRAHNRGWRIDHVVASEELAPQIRAELLPRVMGSDHCPIEAVIV